MKNFLIMAVLSVLVATPALAFTSVVGSKHDMIATNFAVGSGGSTEICIFCHTPHGAQTSTGGDVPLWNNTADGTKDVTGYYSNTAAMVINQGSTINFNTNLLAINTTDARLCLACHDSGVGMPVNQPNSGDMIAGAAVMGASALLGRDLSNDHPIGMDLGASPEVADRYIRPLAYIRTAFGGVDPFYGGAKDDGVNIMYCSTCHDVHDNSLLNIPFLRISNVGSDLCKACHEK